MNQCTSFKGNCRASPSRQVSHNQNNSEPVDVAESKTALLPPLGQVPDMGKHINLKGDHCTPPSRQVFQPNKSINELVDEAVIEQAGRGNHPPDSGVQEEENSESQKAPKIQHPLTQEGNKRWKKSRTDQTIEKCKRLGKPLQKGVQPTSQPSPPTATPPADMVNNPDPTPDHNGNVWNIDIKTQNIDPSTEQKIISGNLNNEVFTQRSDPFKVERVNAVLAELTIGDDLTQEQHVSIKNTLCEFADCFVLSMSEVTVVAGATHTS
jgi:hypothetical protein